LRYTWPSWSYALSHDLLGIKIAGGWSSAIMVERYAHLMLAGQEMEIRALWHGCGIALAGRVLMS
jgi:hypothetical protein